MQQPSASSNKSLITSSHFVSLQRDFWLGLDAKNQLTNEAVTELCVDLQKRNVVYAHFSTFYMGVLESVETTVG